jgi:diguanylate cyclase (GGDEF)-like protein/PAS domain S-box-containing protein
VAHESTGRPVPPRALSERFLELTTDVAGAIGFDGRLVGANPALKRLIGTEIGQLATRNAVTLLHPDDREALSERWVALVEGDRPTAEIEVRLGSGDARRWFLLSLVVDRDAELVYIIGKDVHASREAGERLSDAEARFRSAFDNSSIGITVTGLDARFVQVNEAFARLVGRSVDELSGTPVRDVSHPDEWDADRELVEELMADPGGIVQREKRYLRPDGGEVLALLSVSAVTGADGTAQYLIAQMIDITQQRAAERALAESEQRFRTLAVASPAGIFALDFKGRIVYANDRLCEIFGMEPEEVDGWRWLERVEADSRAPLLQVAETLAAAGTGRVALDIELVPEAGVRWVRIHVAAVTEGGRHGRFVGTIDDVSAEVEAREALAAREAEYRMLAENSGDCLSRHDLGGRYLYISPASEAMLGYKPEEMVGRSARDLRCIHPDDLGTVAALRTELAEGRRTTATAAYRMVRPDGGVRWVETAARAVFDAHGDPVQIVAVTRDVSERKDAETKLAHQALHDALTGLPNRALFLDRLEQALRRARRQAGAVAVLFVDLDRFKLINDSFGHAAGDRLLCDVAARMDHALRPADTIARFGGDELVVLCEGLDGEAGARAIAHRIAALFDEPFVVEDGEAFLQASVGIALASGGASAENLIRDADAAMYRAKDSGRGRVEIFDEAMRNDARERVATESALRRAIERDELRIHVQPVVRMADEAIIAFEALIRWEHPERGLVSPGEFIPLAEETGLIVPIGNWVIREVCRTMRRWADDIGADWIPCSVNLSVRHLQQPDLVATVRAALEEHGVPPRRLILEITESAVMENGTGTVETLEALRALGVRLALDDFGTGYSSLAHLHRFPLDILKIDRSFTAALHADHQGASIAGAIVSLAQALELETVAEGIEDSEQHRQLERLGASYGQGFLFSRPLPPEAFDERLRGPRPVRQPSPTPAR